MGMGQNHRIRKVQNGIITSVAGGFVSGFEGDNGPAIASLLNQPFRLTIDALGHVDTDDLTDEAVDDLVGLYRRWRAD